MGASQVANDMQKGMGDTKMWGDIGRGGHLQFLSGHRIRQ